MTEERTPLVSWTIKLVHPDGDVRNPDFIRVEDGDPDAAMDLVAYLRDQAKERGYQEVGWTRQETTTESSEGGQKLKQPAPSGDGKEELAVKYEIVPARGDSLELRFYGLLPGGQVMEYPFTRTWGSPQQISEALAPVVQDVDWDSDLPIEDSCTWLVKWKPGKEIPSKPGEHYRDFVSVRPAPSD